MADVVGAYVEDSWEGLRANPIFKRTVLPRGVRNLVRSPIVRAVLLTPVALTIYNLALRFSLSIWPAITVGVLFWFCIEAIQRYFCWLELRALTASGTLLDYLNSGFGRPGIVLGIVYPAILAENLSILGIIGYFLYGELTSPRRGSFALVMVVVAFLVLMRLFGKPRVFLPDVESYMRKRNALALFFIGLSVIVPLVLWFGIYYAVIFGGLFIVRTTKSTMTPGTFSTLAFVAAFMVSQPVLRAWAVWRLKRFYKRYGSFDGLFDRYLEESIS